MGFDARVLRSSIFDRQKRYQVFNLVFYQLRIQWHGRAAHGTFQNIKDCVDWDNIYAKVQVCTAGGGTKRKE
jgi:hypothetical protein